MCNMVTIYLFHIEWKPSRKCPMVSPFSPPVSSSENPNRDLLKEIRSHEIAISELNSLGPSRIVYQKTGRLFFRKSAKTIIQSEQKQLETAKARLQKTDSSPGI